MHVVTVAKFTNKATTVTANTEKKNEIAPKKEREKKRRNIVWIGLKIPTKTPKKQHTTKSRQANNEAQQQQHPTICCECCRRKRNEYRKEQKKYIETGKKNSNSSTNERNKRYLLNVEQERDEV